MCQRKSLKTTKDSVNNDKQTEKQIVDEEKVLPVVHVTINSDDVAFNPVVAQSEDLVGKEINRNNQKNDNRSQHEI